MSSQRSDTILDDISLIVVGDLNLTLSPNEFWGPGKIDDPIAKFFKSKMEEKHLIDIVSNVACPTWSNGRCGTMRVAKWLDRFLMVEDLCDALRNYKTWSHSLGFSDHKAIILQIDIGKSKDKYPFKFNPIWFEDKFFCDFVTEK